MTSLSKVSLADLAKKTDLKFTKTGGAGNKGPFVDPFTLDESFPIEITADEVTENPSSGSPQLQLAVSIIQPDGKLKKAGKLWVDLIDETADTATQIKQGQKLLRFLRAVDPTNFAVFASIDKSVEPWVYRDADGNEMTAEDRVARGAEVDAAVVGASAGFVSGDLSVTGMRCYVTKKANPNNAKYPYVNFSAEPAGE